MALVEIRDVHKRFGAQEVLKGISLNVEAGDVVCLLGASGSGKTTLLRCINHLETIDEGEIKVAGELVGYARGSDGKLKEEPDKITSAKRARIGMVFQRFNLLAISRRWRMSAKRRCKCWASRKKKRKSARWTCWPVSG